MATPSGGSSFDPPACRRWHWLRTHSSASKSATNLSYAILGGQNGAAACRISNAPAVSGNPRGQVVPRELTQNVSKTSYAVSNGRLKHIQRRTIKLTLPLDEALAERTNSKLAWRWHRDSLSFNLGYPMFLVQFKNPTDQSVSAKHLRRRSNGSLSRSKRATERKGNRLPSS